MNHIIWSKIKNSGEKFNFWSNIEILVKNKNSGEKFNFWSKMEILGKN